MRPVRSTSTTGGRAFAPAASSASARARASRNAGDSETDTRIHSPMTTSTPDSRNGIRQPQARNASSDWTAASSASTPVASRFPPGAPACGHEAQNPRLRSSPCSATSSTAPPHSPPSANPCTSRSTVSRTGAPTPMLACVGSSPIAKVAPPIINRLSTSSRLRPIRSP